MTILSLAEVAARMSPADQPGVVTEGMVAARVRSGRWPSTKIGRLRGMTEDHVREALDIEAIAATNIPKPPNRSGLSTRSRHSINRERNVS